MSVVVSSCAVQSSRHGGPALANTTTRVGWKRRYLLNLCRLLGRPATPGKSSMLCLARWAQLAVHSVQDWVSLTPGEGMAQRCECVDLIKCVRAWLGGWFRSTACAHLCSDMRYIQTFYRPTAVHNSPGDLLHLMEYYIKVAITCSSTSPTLHSPAKCTTYDSSEGYWDSNARCLCMFE